VPKARYDNQRDLWGEERDTEVLPHRPDAFFTLRFPERPDGQQEMHFYYERDRKTTLDRKRIVRKLRAHFHYIVKHRQHELDYGIKRIRAVLIETTDDQWGMHLRSVARHPLSGKGSSLFWFTHSRLFTHGPRAALHERSPVKGDFFLDHPEVIFHPLWAPAAEDRLCSLLDP
jgi:hypothetical protein